MAPARAQEPAVGLVDDLLPRTEGYVDPREPVSGMPDFRLIPMGGFRRAWEKSLMEERDWAALRERREEVGSELRVRVKSLIPFAEDAGTFRGPRQLAESYLQALLELKFEAALPELVELEDRLVRDATYDWGTDYSLHQEVLSVLAALCDEGKCGNEKVFYDQTQRDLIVAAARNQIRNLPVVPRPRSESPAVALLDQVNHWPGAWDQMCNGAERIPPNWLPLFGFRRTWNVFYLSEANFIRLREQREGVLEEIGQRLPASISVGVERAKARRRGDRAEWPDSALENYLAILEDLNGVECLPQLLALERGLQQVALYDLSEPGLRPNEHAQVLSVITLLLQNEKASGLDRLEVPGIYQEEHRERIVELAQRFLKVTDPASYQGAGAMSAQMKYR